ncbi:NAD(P)-dependent oxidoreductase [Methylotetracoccus oryzae]|uniref:NAD(P)-dependent oxidoreductase n=1 Tax=Methylotetracoccus oryzae TaxID=1919059 RepID=UPI0011185938|nr:NAD(P)-dependent oxidoreductase [Methylotetracoccus oryzae]
MKVGFVGLGAMGEPMARNLAAAGLLAAVWNRTPARAAALSAALGIDSAPSPAELAATVDVVIICVSADADVIRIVDALRPAARPGLVVVDCSTVSPDTARKAAQRLGEGGAEFLDAPVTGGVEGARSGRLAMMIGGSPATLAKVEPALSAMATRIVFMGDTGAGQAAKAVNQVMCAGINQAVTEALAFGEKLGLDMDRVIDVVSGGAAGNWFLEKRGPTMTRGTFAPGFKLALHHKDLAICLSMAANMQIDLPLTAATLDDYTALMADGFGDEDISALYRRKRP